MPIKPPIENSKHTFQKPYSRYYLILLWAILILAVCMNGFLKQYYAKKVKLRLNANPILQKTNPNIILTGKYAIGAKTIYSLVGKNTVQGLSGNLITQLKGHEKGYIDQVGLTPLIAELAGKETAIQHTNELIKNPDMLQEHIEDLYLYQKLYKNGKDELNQNDRNRLIERHQWIGKLALTYGLPFSDPARKEVLTPAIRTFIVSILFMGFVLVSGLAGLVLLLVTIVLWGRGILVTSFEQLESSNPGRMTILLETTVVFFIVILISNILSWYMPRLYFWCLYLFLIIFTFYFPIFRGFSFKSLKIALGWYKGKGVLREIGSGLLGYLTGLPLIICGCLVTFMIMKYTGTQPIHPIVHQFRDAGLLKLIWLFTIASIIAPLIEESLFRGVFYQYLRSRFPVFVSSVISGFIFAAIHPQGYAAIPALGLIGVVFALIREWRGSLIAPVTAHALNNFMITLLLIFTLAGRG